MEIVLLLKMKKQRNKDIKKQIDEIIDLLEGKTDKTKDIVKKVNVKITYMFKAKEQTVELSTILTKEN